MDIWLWILIGLVCGIFSALFGVGAGIIMIPALVLVVSLPQKSAQGVALAIMVPMALTGAIRYKMDPANTMDMKMIAFLAIGGVAGALLGAWLVTFIKGDTLRKVFAVIMVVTALKMFFTAEGRGRKPDPEASRPGPAVESAASDASPPKPLP